MMSFLLWISLLAVTMWGLFNANRSLDELEERLSAVEKRLDKELKNPD